jgi:MYXO-CTERM domain-containing protein
VIASDHRLVAGVFDGLVRSSPDGCDYAPSDDPAVRRLYVIDMVRDPVTPSTLWAITSPGSQPNTVIRSLDDGASWEIRGTPHPTALFERVRVAPSDPDRVYVSAVIPRTATSGRRALVFSSTDGGRTFSEVEIPLEGEERNVHVLAVDPTDPDRVLLRMVRLVTDDVPERLLLSEDGARTFATAASLLEITGCTFSSDGARVWVGGWDGAFLRSDAGGAVGSFVPVTGQEALRVRCLSYREGDGARPDELWICTDDLRGDFALGRSTDGGPTIERIWGFSDATADTGCPACSAVGSICPGYWPDVVFDLGLPMDAGVPDLDGGVTACDGSIGADTGSAPSSCACRAGRGASPALAALMVVAIALALRRR